MVKIRMLRSEKNIWMANFEREAKRKLIELDHKTCEKAIEFCEAGLTHNQAIERLQEDHPW